MINQKEAEKIVEKLQKEQQDEALKLFRERWWDRLHKIRFYSWIHGWFMGRAGEITIILRKDNKITLRPWLSKKASKDQTVTFHDIYKYIYWMSDNMVVIDQHNKNVIILSQMVQEYKDKHGFDPKIDDLFRESKITIN